MDAPVEEGLDRRQRRWRQLHGTIYDAACELFLETGFEETSMDQIAERADVARKTAFNHFPRKRDIIAEWGNRRRLEVRQALSADLLAKPDLEAVLRHYLSGLARQNERERALTRRMLMGWREHGGPFDADPHALADIFERFVVAAVERGDVVAKIHPRMVATMLYASYFGFLYEWCAGTDEEPPFDLEDALMDALDVVLVGLDVDIAGRP
ncbi:TetR/AcrR family transcriptional regulator [Nocardioides mangrovi]|uniref:TetR/AcrR family transcriptional regulator n=1 Tax=Nocardioides mangrovi TaxID=2874580 RepID=A0ABS7UFK1_9ACTN|nr:TetR/AcrR family transcriptional regulator [Nocardioides mangrovi]MBZ5739562.1 TetR/AcrR family transcriptional regulator [Nocardioides mangrovi]